MVCLRGIRTSSSSSSVPKKERRRRKISFSFVFFFFFFFIFVPTLYIKQREAKKKFEGDFGVCEICILYHKRRREKSSDTQNNARA